MANQAMVTTPSKPISLEEFLALPETKPASEYDDVLPVPDFAQAFQLTLGELFGWLLE